MIWYFWQLFEEFYEKTKKAKVDFTVFVSFLENPCFKMFFVDLVQEKINQAYEDLRTKANTMDEVQELRNIIAFLENIQKQPLEYYQEAKTLNPDHNLQQRGW